MGGWGRGIRGGECRGRPRDGRRVFARPATGPAPSGEVAGRKRGRLGPATVLRVTIRFCESLAPAEVKLHKLKNFLIRWQSPPLNIYVGRNKKSKNFGEITASEFFFSAEHESSIYYHLATYSPHISMHFSKL